MKKTYISPTIKEYILNVPTLLAGSAEINRNDEDANVNVYDAGGGYGGVFNGREYDFEEDEY